MKHHPTGHVKYFNKSSEEKNFYRNVLILMLSAAKFIDCFFLVKNSSK